MFKDAKGDIWYQVGLHIHTTISDGKKTPEEMARIYKNAGFDAVAITDHWMYHDTDEIGGLKIISGCEYNVGSRNTIGDTMHIVGFGMKTDPKMNKGEVSRQQVIDGINQNGGFAVLAHPHWSLNDKKDVKELSGFSFVEIYNSVSDVNMSNRPDSSYLIDSLANDGVILPLIATDDAHFYIGQDDARSFVRVKADSGEISDILQALKAGKYYSSQGPHLEVRREGNKIICECSPCQKIAFMSNCSYAPDRMLRADQLHYAEYEINDFEKWIRVEITDCFGNRAWSNIIEL